MTHSDESVFWKSFGRFLLAAAALWCLGVAVGCSTPEITQQLSQDDLEREHAQPINPSALCQKNVDDERAKREAERACKRLNEKGVVCDPNS